MQRSRLTTALAGLGLASACADPAGASATVTPRASSGPAPGDVEPSGLRATPKPTVATRTGPGEPSFEGVPTGFCQANLQRRDDTLIETQSYLAIWNELAPPIRNPRAPNIPVTEIDARVAVCGAEQCTVDQARVVEVTADSMVGVGVVIPTDAGFLVVPSVAMAHAAGSCTNTTRAEIVDHGRFVHLRVVNQEQHYSYGHGHGGYGYPGYGGYAYDSIPLECLTYTTLWRDLVVDRETGELELAIERTQAEGAPTPELEIEFPRDPSPTDAAERGLASVVLRGCGSTLELQWTDPSAELVGSGHGR